MTGTSERTAQRKKGIPWVECFAKLKNAELMAFAGLPLNGAQFRIVLYIIAQTRGTGRLTGDRATMYSYDDYQEALAGYDREWAPLFHGNIADGTGLTRQTVCTELKHLEEAGIVVREGTASKTTPARYRVNFETAAWRIDGGPSC
jgi:hypothetical protein